MSAKGWSVIGILVGISCLVVATLLFPGGFDWSHDFISTLLRGPVGASRTIAEVGVLLFCLSVGFMFARLSKAEPLPLTSSVVRIGGIGAMVYASLTITPMHDVMVTISLLFLLPAILALLLSLFKRGERGDALAGLGCLIVLLASATVYYTGWFLFVLPWAQRLSFGYLTGWLVALDWRTRRNREG